jgi:hypothetical protein
MRVGKRVGRVEVIGLGRIGNRSGVWGTKSNPGVAICAFSLLGCAVGADPETALTFEPPVDGDGPDTGGSEGEDGDDGTGGDGTGDGGSDGGDDGSGDDGGGGDGGTSAECGNDVLEYGEECDGAEVGGTRCADFESPSGMPFGGGFLGCDEDCTFNVDQCTWCGDGETTDGEVCDGNDLNDQDCGSQGFDGGSLVCAADCQDFDTVACTVCGNDVVESDEQCDGVDLAELTCVTEGFPSGTIACDTSCMLDVSGCTFMESTFDLGNFATGGAAGSSLSAFGVGEATVQIAIPADMKWLSLRFEPRDYVSDQLSIELTSGVTVVSSCNVGAGQICDLGGSIDVAAHQGGVLVATVTDKGNDDIMTALDIHVGGGTEGISTPFSYAGVWRAPRNTSCGNSDYALWPVGPATGAVAYAWADDGNGTSSFDAGLMLDDGTIRKDMGVSAPNTTTWPAAGTPQGWYLFGTAGCDSATQFRAWHLTVTP